MHIVFIVGSYYPYYSAVGKCVGNVAAELEKNNKVTVICKKKFTEQINIEYFHNQRIIRVETWEDKFRNKLNIGIHSKRRIYKQICKFTLNVYRISKVIKTIFSKVSINKELINSYVDALNKIEEPVDVIIPASMPFESVVAASKFVNQPHNKSILIPYLFDQFTGSDTLHRYYINKLFKRKWHLDLEKFVFSNSFSILAMHSLNKHFFNNLSEFKNINFIEHPLILENIYSNKISNDDNEITISYIGGLYKNYVTPHYLLELFRNCNLEKAKLHFYIVGNCDEIVNKYCCNFPEKIINHGSVDKEIVDREVARSSILISIAEKKGIQMSSKIFEYMSAGKPIIHFYTVDEDVNLKILKKYSLALCLKQELGNLEQNIKLFVEFCQKHSSSRMLYEEVEELFYDATPKFTAKLINKLIEPNKFN
ncbi:Glycosyltransferase involved in cell wall bisynthesis [Paenibacillus sp. UNCCL117]|uniref:glycosyltransferase n=1 Tax=unclassified Paenibacillus TaxID=185978 RepID=UPI00088CAAA0|nr:MULTISPECIES: glycosyltransferase [unclassified Paenibacillus]SDC04354.1 Glycosyltransferase involved in cell wall bisynthesis [Paenibacillus sp. cl123]SFW37300.1 Glycosyltransferase involved in cell wall bisynthesis [Paenibacillus sp. UNCCL117]